MGEHNVLADGNDLNHLNPEPRYVVPGELTFFTRGQRALAVSPDPPGWAIVNNDVILMLQALPRGTPLTAGEIELILAGKGRLIDSGLLADTLSQLSDAYVLGSEGRSGEDAPSPLKAAGLYIELTSSCNLRCKHCYTDAGVGHVEELSAEEVLGVIRQLEPPAEIGFSGGEPLLHPDCLELMLDATRDGYKCTLVTNGLLVTPETAQILAKADIMVQVSFESSHKELHEAIRGRGSYEKALHAIKLLRQEGCRVRVSFTPCRVNAGSFGEYVDFSESLGVNAIHVCTFTPQGRGGRNRSSLQLRPGGLRDLQLLIDRLKARIEIMGGLPETLEIDRVGLKWARCPLGGSLRIGADGDIFCCEIAVSRRFVIGNIRRTTIEGALAGPAMRALSEHSHNRVHLVVKCRQCLWRNFCGGGCMVLSDCMNTGFCEPDYYCALRKEWFPRLLWRQAEPNLKR